VSFVALALGVWLIARIVQPERPHHHPPAES
jgi:hypothetical protein